METLLTSLEMSDRERKDETGGPNETQGPLYPWGLTLRLEDKVIKKLGLGDAKVGDTVGMVCRCSVVSKSECDGQDGAHRSLELQITDATASPDVEALTTEQFIKEIMG
jgi:hypothetical protein